LAEKIPPVEIEILAFVDEDGIESGDAGRASGHSPGSQSGELSLENSREPRVRSSERIVVVVEADEQTVVLFLEPGRVADILAPLVEMSPSNTSGASFEWRGMALGEIAQVMPEGDVVGDDQNIFVGQRQLSGACSQDQ
jgi:hypothetical protein